jgi:F420H(2)-dependent biliverdin reductase
MRNSDIDKNRVNKDVLEENLLKLQEEKNIWLACVRPDGRPHLTPVWFVFYIGKIYISTDPNNIKVRNLKNNPHAALALEDGVHPVICETKGRQMEPPHDQAVVDLFKKKYDWDITTETQYNQLWEFTPLKWLSW